MARTSATLFPAVRDGEHLGLEALSLADRAEERDVGEELHLDGLVSFAAAGLAAAAAAAADVEREVRWREAARRAPAASPANRARMRSHACVYVAGLPRAVRPSGD